MTQHTLAELQRPSGGYAMLAVDQREALRTMMAEHSAEPVSDQQVQDFKVAATEILSPHASAVLVDRQFAWDAVVEQGVVASSCALISSADHFESAHGETVGRVTIDRQQSPEKVAEQGAVAMKLLVLWRPDEPPGGRIEMVQEFVARCHGAGLLAIIEPMSRPRSDGQPSDPEAGVLAAAKELGSLGADLYKAEVPHKAKAPAADIRAAAAQITAAVASPWVVLSSGVAEADFPAAVRLCMAEGADGFLAGRAVWASSLAAPDRLEDLRTKAVGRLRALGDLVDTALEARP